MTSLDGGEKFIRCEQGTTESATNSNLVETVVSRRLVQANKRDGVSCKNDHLDATDFSKPSHHHLDNDLQCGLASKQAGAGEFVHFRFLIVSFAGLAVGLMMLLRYNMTISILKMVNQTHMYLEDHPNDTLDNFLAEGYSQGGEFNWNNRVVAIILSWYMFSYTLPQVASSRLSIELGCRLFVPISLTICGLASLLTPPLAYFGWKYVVALRLANGLGASALLPMLLHIVETWVRYDEISLGLSIGQTLTTCLTTLTPLISGCLASYHWSYTFYVPGFLTLAFCALWLVLVTDRPELSSFISKTELNHILNGKDEQRIIIYCEKQEAMRNEQLEMVSGQSTSDYKADSWYQIFQVRSFYVHMLIWCISCSTYTTFLFILPTYMQQLLRLNVAQNGFYCFMIQSGSIISVLWPYPLIRELQRRGFTLTQSRIAVQSICCFIVTGTWCYVGTFHADQLVVLFLNRCFQGGNGIIIKGALMSNYAKAGLSGTAFSVVNTVGNLAIVAGSTLIGWHLDLTGRSREGWSWLFLALGASEILISVIFAFCVDSEPVKFSGWRRRPGNSSSSDVESSCGGVDRQSNLRSIANEMGASQQISRV